MVRWQWFDDPDDVDAETGLELADEHVGTLYPLVELIVTSPSPGAVSFAWRIEDATSVFLVTPGRA
jgi:hypothetical protein